jgi:hypothetical protein
MAERWEETRRANPVNERRVAAYQRLLEAGEQISQARHRRGESWATIEKALAGSELGGSEVPLEPDLYLTTLTRFVAALGGHVEVRAVFAEETITVRREPDGGTGALRRHPDEGDM